MMKDFRRILEESLPPGEIDLLLASLDTSPPVSIRQHVRKTDKELFPGSEPVTWCPAGRYLEERPVFTLDPRFHAGAYYVQEASGMSLWQLKTFLQSIKTPRVLDACAAPGGKSTLLLDIMPGDGLLVSNEVIRSRIPVLTQNMARWGYSNVVVTQNDPGAFARLPGYFDVLVADVPCSGEGLFRKEPGSRNNWSPAGVDLCASRQRRILTDLWPSLREGGLLFYSTCTFNRKEDEEQVEWMVRHLGARVLLGPEKYFPHRIRGEGFFMALLQKQGDPANPGNNKIAGMNRKKSTPGKDHVPFGIPAFLKEGYAFSMKGTLLKAFPALWQADMTALEQILNVIHSGIAVAQRKGNDWIPGADLALAVDLKKNAFEQHPVDFYGAISFLRRDSLVLPASCEKGFVLITYDDLPLGFVKNLGSRSNNLHPVSRRILMPAERIYTPD
ncbi:MAG: rRNA cytosine-C5-methyltransferase [Bacteroidales bacterium]|jgi:16S rRNA C967 or C1407 C5-methylase (RsmB/RsmF family)/NOL1/NOP2/fmu family ribosome biogenesis protein